MKIMIVSNLSPISIKELGANLLEDFPFPDLPLSAQFDSIALEPKGITYFQSFYYFIKTISNKIANDSLGVSGIRNLICYGTLDIKCRKNFDLVLGLRDNDTEDYTDFSKSDNPTNIRTIDYSDCDYVYDNYRELKLFLRKYFAFKEKEYKNGNTI